MITRPRACIGEDGAVDVRALASVISDFQKQIPALNAARDQYNGIHEIGRRTRSLGVANNKLVHGFPRYITTMASGYLIGSPVSYTTAEKDSMERELNVLLDAYKRMSSDSIDVELAEQASIYGKGVELVFSDGDARPRSATIDPREAFVVYDDTVEHKPLFGVHFYKEMGVEGNAKGYRVTVYTATATYTYGADETSARAIQSAGEVSAEYHYFGDVPLVEYWNNGNESGDFTPVMSLIDAYNTLQSDRVNDKEQFVDAILVISGAILGGDDPADKRPPAHALREDKLIQFMDKEAKAEWLSKQLNESEVEVLKNAIKADIHKMSMVPDLTDQEFAGNVSGVAMRYKLLGLEQLTKVKERWFREALRTRMRLFANFLAVKGEGALDVDQVQITFTRALPTNDVEVAQMVSTLNGMVPNEILLSQIPFVANASEALEQLKEQLKEQRQESIKEQASLFSQYPDANARRDDAQGEAE